MAAISSTTPTVTPSTERSALRQWLINNRRAFSSVVILLVLWLIFFASNTEVFSNQLTYKAIFTTLPGAIFLVVPLTFIVTGGEIDLSFPAVMGVASWGFAIAIRDGWDPFAAAAIAIVIGVVLGALVGVLVVYANLSALIATVGMNFLLRGFINVGAEGYSIAIPALRKTAFYQVFGGEVLGFPIQMLWAVAFVILGWFLYNRHKFGSQVHCVGDNPDSSREMGINVKRVRVTLFLFSGLGAALAGIASVLINFVWWPTTGDGFLLPALASIFVGGTPAWGGIGTVVGGAFGAAIVRVIEPGVIAAGLSGFYTQFFYGLIIIVSLIGHRFNGPRYR